MNNSLSLAAIILSSTVVFPAHAQNPVDIQPGLWEYQMEMKIPGMQVNVPPQTMKRCLTPEDVAKSKHLAGDSGKNPCTISNLKTSGGKLSYDVVCKTERGTMKGSASGTASTTALDFDIRLQMVPPLEGMSEMSQKMRAKRIGSC